jgi:hypothetical protein
MSGPVDLGQTYRYRQTVKDAAGALANAGTVTLIITLPDGTTASPAAVNSSTGIYDFSYTTTQAGLHYVSGSATGGVLSAEFDKWEDSFTVETAGQMFVSVDEAAAHLRASGVITSEADREQLRWLCLAACDAVERDLGRVIARRTVNELHDGGQSVIMLRKSPVISIVSVTDSNVSLTAAEYTVDTAVGILYRGAATGWATRFAYGRQAVLVSYVAGYLQPPRVARMAALNLVQSMWQSSQQAFHPALDELSAESFAAAALPGVSQIPGYDSLRTVGVA